MSLGESAHLDDNSRATLTALSNDGSLTIYNVRSNPITGAIICEADVLSSNTSIGGTIPGGTEGSVLFLGPGSTLDQDNLNFFYNPTSHFLGLGTDNPTATLDLRGTLKIDLGGDSTGDIYFRNSSGFIEALPIGTNGQILSVNTGLPAWESNSSVLGYDTIETNGTPVTQRSVMNFSTLFDVTDSASPARTNIDIDVSNLANDSDFIDELIANTYFTTNLANDPNFYTTLANNTSFITALTSNTTFQSDIVTIINTDISIQIDLTTQVMGILPLANGGTGEALSDPGYDAIMGWDNTDNAVSFWHIGTGLSYNHSTHTISATGTIEVDENGSSVVSAATKINFTGSVNVTDAGGGQANIDILSGAYTSGTVNYAGSGDITIAHGLGTTPSHIRISTYFVWDSSGGPFGTSLGTYDGTDVSTIYQNFTGDPNYIQGIDTTDICFGEVSSGGGTLIRFSPTMDATNITLTKNASGSPVFILLWEAYA